jgi:hypothetical protein
MKTYTLLAVAVLLGAPAMAQQVPSSTVVPVEQSIPFGTVSGRLLLLGNYLVFVDDQQPDSSLVIPRVDIENLTSESGAITVQVREPVRDRSGEVRRLSFRVTPPADGSGVASWYARRGSGAPVSASGSASRVAPVAAPADTESFPARHDHRLGSCRGRLIVTPAQLSYESTDDVSHSRRWEYKSVKEIAAPNPYELEIKPFSGGTYKFLLEGSGMSPTQYKTLVDRVTAARAAL